MSKLIGGQAFPKQQWEYDGQNNVLQYQEDGMTLRDYFAAKAMQSIVLANTGIFEMNDADEAYSIAERMLKAREQQRGEGE